MIDRLVDMLLRRSRRERWLLGLALALALPALAHALVIAPLQARHRAALAARAEAAALADWVVERAAEADRLATPDRRAPAAPIGIAGLEQSLRAAGLRAAATELGSLGDGRVELRFDAVPFTDLAGWLSGSDPVWGYDIAAFRFERGAEPGLVAAELTLQPVTP